MKKIAFITKNKILAQSLAATMKSMPELEFELVLLLNSHQVLLDAEVLEIDVALIDVGFIDTIDNNKEGRASPLTFWTVLHNSLPNCHLLLLVSQDDIVNRKMATQAKQMKIIEDFVFYDASLKYLFAKLAAFG